MKKYYETIHSVSLQQNCLPFYVLVPNGLHRISIGNRHGSSKILILTSKPQHFEMSRSFFKIKSSPMEDLNGALNWKSIDLSKKHYFPMSKIITNMFLSDVPEGTAPVLPVTIPKSPTQLAIPRRINLCGLDNALNGAAGHHI